MPDQAIDKVGYSHEKMIDMLVQNPRITQRELATRFGYSEGWISQVVRSDAFREMYAARRAEVVDPLVMQSLEARFEFLANKSLDVLEAKLDLPNVGVDAAIKALEVTSRAMGYGAAKAGVQINAQNFVVAMPEKAIDGNAWLAGHAPRVIDAGSTAD